MVKELLYQSWPFFAAIAGIGAVILGGRFARNKMRGAIRSAEARQAERRSS
jgi:hypothetical protein